MNVRSAKISDAKAINALISSYAEMDRMLFRSLADIYENGPLWPKSCAILSGVRWKLSGPTWQIKSWRSMKHIGKGIGSSPVAAAVEEAAKLGVPRSLH
jgi:hypothetical protein